MSASYLDLYLNLEIDSATNSEINYKRYTPYTGAAGKLLSINESSQLEN
jgi:hypothetical protein